MHPSYSVQKIYHVTLNQAIQDTHLAQLQAGFSLDDGFIKPDDIRVSNDMKQVRIVLHSGKNHIIRRMFAHMGYRVTYLNRSGFAGLTQKTLGLGQYRSLTAHEIAQLQKSGSVV
jgi:23S rRNA pseudouridine2605 synthase